MKKQAKKNGVSAGAVIAIGAGVAALAAGSYFFFGPEGKKNRGKLTGWMIKMKGEVVEKMESAKEMTEAAYNTIVDKVAATYGKKYAVAADEIKAFAEGLKKQWKGITKSSTKKPAAKKAAAKAK